MTAKISITFDVESPDLDSLVIRDLLSLLNRYRAKSTFFVLGSSIKQDTGVVNKILDDGHEVGCHGYIHDPPYNRRSLSSVQNDVRGATRILQQFCEVSAFRCPYFLPHTGLAIVLEDLNYSIDSSVPAQRFDFFVGRSNRFEAMFASRRPYHPSYANIYRENEDNLDLIEIPLSCFLLPLAGVTLRNFDLKAFMRILGICRLFSNSIVMDFHLWEFKIQAPAAMPYRHRKRIGKEMLSLFQNLLQILSRNGYPMVPISQIS